MIVIIIKDNQWTTTNNNTEPWTMNRETWTMHHEPWTFFSWWWSYPSLFSYFSFFEKKILPFFASFVNPLVFTRWRRTPGCYSATWMNNNNNFMKQQHWTMNIFFSDGGLTPHFFFQIHFLRRRSYPSSLHLSILWSSPGGELLVVTVPHEWTTTKTLLNNNTEPWTFFSVMVVLPLIFFIFIFWEEGLTLLRFICQSSGLHQVERTSWSSPGGAGRAQKSPHDAGR